MDRYIVPCLAASNILKLMSPIVVVVLCRIPVMLIKQNDSIVLLPLMMMPTTTIQQYKALWEIPWHTSPFSCLRAVHQLLCLMGGLGLCIRTLRSTDNTTDVL